MSFAEKSLRGAPHKDFRFIRGNFLKGRTFKDDEDLNRQAEEWCRKKNAGFDKERKVWLPRLFEEEKAHLIRLPAYQPPECLWHYLRRVDAYGRVSLDGNYYSAPNEYVGKLLTLKETMESVTMMDGQKELCVHPRLPDGERGESRLPGHGRDASRRRTTSARVTTSEERWLIDRSPVLATFVQGLKRLGGRRYPYQVRKLYALCHEYEVLEVEKVVERALLHDLFEVTRLEGMLLLEYGARLFTFNRRERGDGPGSVTPVSAPVDPRLHSRTDEQAVEKNDPDSEPIGGDDDGVA